MTAVVFAFEIIAVFLVSLYLVHKYGNWRKDHWATSVSVLATWFLCFAVIFVLPSDISATLYNRCVKSGNGTAVNAYNKSICHRPWSYVTESTQSRFWALTYWSLQLLSWLVLPFIQSYVMAAQFTIRGKMFQMLKENAIWYGSFLVIILILFIYIIAKGLLQWANIKTMLTTASNTWGLLILVLLLGYGLVDMPRSFWNEGRLEYQMQKTYYQVAKLRNDMEEAKEKLDEVFKDVKLVSERIRYNNPNRHCVDTILAKCPDDLASQGSRGVDDFEDYTDGRQTDLTTMSGLVALHGRVIKSTRNSKRTEVQYKQNLTAAIAYEDLEENKHSRTRIFMSSIPAKRWSLHALSPGLEWWWRIRIRPVLWIMISSFSTLATLVFLWSEVTFFSKSPVLSIPALIVGIASHGARDIDESDSRNDYALIEVFTIFCLAYLASCAYYPIYKIRLFNFYYLAPNHQTDQGSLLFNAMFISRVVAPLCLNFLGLIHMDSHVSGDQGLEDTAFTQTMGHLDVLAFMSKYFFIYFPIILCVLSVLTLFRLGTHIMACCGFQAFLYNDEMTTELVKQGKNYTRIERRSRERNEKRQAAEASKTRGSQELTTLRHHEPVPVTSDQSDLEAGGDSAAHAASRPERDNKRRYNSRYSRIRGNDDTVTLTSGEETPIDTSPAKPVPHISAKPVPHSSAKPVPHSSGSKHPVLPKLQASTASRPSPSTGRSGSRAPPRNLFDDI